VGIKTDREAACVAVGVLLGFLVGFVFRAARSDKWQP